MVILIEKSSTQTSPLQAIERAMRYLEAHDYAEVSLNIQIRLDGEVRTITVLRA